MQPTVSKLADRFEIALSGTPVGETFFVDTDGHRLFFHTEVAEEFSGQGLAGELIASALNATRAEGLRIMASCPYVRRWLQSHHDHDDILDPVTEEALQAIPME